MKSIIIAMNQKEQKTQQDSSQQEEVLKQKCDESLSPTNIISKQIKESSSNRRAAKRKKKQLDRKKILQEAGKAGEVFRGVIKDIYQIGISYENVSKLLSDCFLLEEDSNILYSQIYEIIQVEINLIRHKIISDLVVFKMHPEQVAKARAIKSLFRWIWKIQRGSPEIQKVLSLLARQRFCSKEKNFLLNGSLDILTLQFIYKQELLPSPTFIQITEQIRSHQREYEQEIHILDTMIQTSQKKPPSPVTEKNSDESEPEEQVQPLLLPEQSPSKKKPKHKKKAKRPEQLYKSNPTYQEVTKRAEELTLREDDRTNCNVEESWLERLRLRQAELWKNLPLRP